LKIIKRYENRCLYDAELSTNVTLHDLKQYVIDYVPFKIINAKTEEDLTRSYLIQIILELENMDTPLFSQQSLENIIRFYGHPLQQWYQKYLEQTLNFMVEQQKVMQKTVQNPSAADFVTAWQNVWDSTLKKKDD